MRRFIFIINPISGTKNKGLLQKQIEDFAKSKGYVYDIFPSVASGDYSFLFPFIKEHDVTDAVIAGGDGTINAALNSLRVTGITFGLLPCGSGNGLAFSAGIPKNIQKALQIIDAGKSAAADAFTINGQFACMLCGLGYDAQVAHDFAADPKRGLTTYIKKAAVNFFSAKTFPFHLVVDKHTLDVDAYFISIANSNQFGNNFTIAPMASLTDGLLDVVIVTQQNKLNMLLQTVRQVAGFNQVQQLDIVNTSTSIIYLQAKNISIKNSGEAPLHVDGDPAETATEIDIKILKKAFKLIFP